MSNNMFNEDTSNYNALTPLSALSRSVTTDIFSLPYASFVPPSLVGGEEEEEEDDKKKADNTIKCVLCKQGATHNFNDQTKPLYCPFCAFICAEGCWEKTSLNITGERCQSDFCDGYAIYYPVNHSVSDSSPVNVYCYHHRHGLMMINEGREESEIIKKCYPVDMNKPSTEEVKKISFCRAKDCVNPPTHNYIQNPKGACCFHHALVGMVRKE